MPARRMPGRLFLAALVSSSMQKEIEKFGESLWIYVSGILKPME
jgi:hypothetical protein